MEGNVGNGQSRRGARDGQRTGVGFGIRGKDKPDYLGLAREPFGKQRANGPVDLPAVQDFALGGTAFALDEASGYAAGGVGILAIVHGQRKERGARLRVRIARTRLPEPRFRRTGQPQNHAPALPKVRFRGRFSGLPIESQQNVALIFLQSQQGKGRPDVNACIEMPWPTKETGVSARGNRLPRRKILRTGMNRKLSTLIC